MSKQKLAKIIQFPLNEGFKNESLRNKKNSNSAFFTRLKREKIKNDVSQIINALRNCYAEGVSFVSENTNTLNDDYHYLGHFVIDLLEDCTLKAFGHKTKNDIIIKNLKKHFEENIYSSEAGKNETFEKILKSLPKDMIYIEDDFFDE